MKTFDAQSDTTNRNQFKTLKTLSQYLWPKNRIDLKIRVLLALASLALAKVVNVYVPFFYKDAVDALSVETAFLMIPVAMILAYGGVRLLSRFFGELRDFIFAKVSQHAQRTIALSTFKHLHHLSLAFHLDRQTGGLSRVIERGTLGIQFVLNFMIFNILPTLLEIIMVVVIFFYKFDYRFALVTIVCIGGYIGFTLWVTEWRLKYRRKMNEKDSEANTKSIDSLINYETVKYFGNEDFEYHRYDKALASYENAAIRNITSLTLLNVGQSLIIGAGLVVIMLLAGQGVVAGEYTVGDFVLVNTFLIQLYLPLNFLGFVYRQIKQSLTDMDKMFELLEVDAEIRDKPGAKPLQAQTGEIEFKGVNFRYEQDREILKDLNFKVPAGKTVAIVGPSGSGKSTISRLLFRFYDTQSGSITIDGEDIKNVTMQSLRTAIGIVPQDTVLFNDSVFYNIQYGRTDASHEGVINAAKLARIHDFVSTFPKGYESLVGERGLKLSGGEKQRISIARAILKNPSILLFDEATSALDSQTENEIQASLKEVSQEKTTLVIAHRLSTIIDADEILVLSQGEITERGTHANLLSMQGEYAAMWARQQEAKEYQAKLNQVLEEKF